MKTLNAVRWAAFLVTLLANADAVETKMMAARSTDERNAKCERCGQSGPTVPVVPVTFGGHSAIRFEAPRWVENTHLGVANPAFRLNPILPVRDEFGPAAVTPTGGAAVTR